MRRTFSMTLISLFAVSLMLVACHDPMEPEGDPEYAGPVQENPSYEKTELQRELQDDAEDPGDAGLEFEEGWGGTEVTETTQ